MAKWEIIEDSDELDEYQKGGKTKKELKDIYGNKILAPIVKVEERSHYDPLSETIYLNSQDYNNPYIVAHENLHALQNKLGTDRFWENRLIPLKKPNIVATPDEAVDYYDRKAIETGIDTNRFLNKNPEFQFVPFNTYYARGIEDQQYDNPESLEGEARYYENTGKVLPPYKLGGKTKNFNWEIIEDDNEIPEYKHGGKTPVWQRKEGKSPTGGLNAKGRASLKKEGHDIKPPQPQGGSRKKSFCARSAGQLKMWPKAAKDPNSRLRLARKKWKC